MPKDNTRLFPVAERSPREAETLQSGAGGAILEADQARIAMVPEPIDTRPPVHGAAPRLAPALRIGEMHVDDTVEADLQYVFDVLAHHRRVVNVVKQAHFGPVDLVNDIETLDSRGEVVAGVID